MSPGGHLITTVAACAASAFLTRSAPPAETLTVVAAIATGGFLIDVDHAVDYVLFERQRDLRPSAFLRYYLEGRVRRTVLALHSYELFALLGLFAWRTDSPVLWGYLMGALMHLALDIIFNGEQTPRSISAFYSFAYRLAHRFDASRLLGPTERQVSPAFWIAFFRGSERPAPAPTRDTEGSARRPARAPAVLASGNDAPLA